MEYELFGISPIGNLEFLGSFIKERQLFKAAEDYKSLGFKNIKFCTWKAKQNVRPIKEFSTANYPCMWLD